MLNQFTRRAWLVPGVVASEPGSILTALSAVSSGKRRSKVSLQFRAAAGASIFTGLFWAWFTSLLTANRDAVVTVFVTVALLAFVALTVIQGGTGPEEMED